MPNTKHESARVLINNQNERLNSITVKSTTFSDIVTDLKFTDPFVLITDIEGGEAPIFFKDGKSLENCFAIVAELDNNEEYSILAQVNQIEFLGFKLTDQYGSNVFIFRRN